MEEVDRRQAAKPDAVGWDGTGHVPGPQQGCPWLRGARTPCPPQHPGPSKEGKEPMDDSARRLQDRWGPCKTIPPRSPWRVALAGGTQPSPGGWTDPAPRTSAGVSGPLSIPPQTEGSLQCDGAGNPFPRPTADICLGGAARAGRGHFQPSVLLCFLHGKKLFPLLSGKLLAIIRQAGGKDSYPSNNAI